jgi:tyrosyl-tRNA synthetase
MPKLKLLARGKVRDIYDLPDEGDGEKLLFVATDRISAFDVIMENVGLFRMTRFSLILLQGIPQKGKTLTTLSLFWFHKLRHIIPNHVLTPRIDSDSPASLDESSTSSWEEFPRSLDEYRDQLEGRSMIVKKCEVVKIEAIVRGYITGQSPCFTR